MNNTVSRLLFVGLAVPALFALAVFVPWMNHAPIALIVLAFVVGAAAELKAMLEPGSGKARTAAAISLALLPPIAVYASGLALELFPSETGGFARAWLEPLSAALLAGFLVSAVPLAFPRSPESIKRSLAEAQADALYLFYPGALSSAILSILAAPSDSGLLLVWFALIVFGNDSLAWLIGVTLGRRKGIFAVSPNKSLEGLLAGLAGSVAATLAGPLFVPSAAGIPWYALAALGIVCGGAVVAGDLFESSLKRAAGVKDSGSIVPGRGGVLDSFDSLLYAAPIFAGFAAVAGLLG